MKNSYLTFTDQFCGAGGSSQGVRNLSKKLGGGIEVKLALNHWKLAIETHNTNFPDTIHDCTDIQACDPRRYPSTDFLITSPECTNHSLAKGKKKVKGLSFFDTINEAEERSRATMWDVPRFTEYHQYNFIIVENVVDARSWILWDAWLKAMHDLGYKHKCVYLNSMHAHPTPQSRDRMYVVFWKKNNPAPDLEFKPKAWCKHCVKDVESYQHFKNKNRAFGKYKQQYVYRCPECNSVVEPYYHAAFNCIDWSKPGQKIGERAKPLSDKTLARIKHGISKYWNHPLIITTRYSSGVDCRVRNAAEEVMPTQPGDASHAILNPFLVNSEHDSFTLKKARSVVDAAYTQTTRATSALVSAYPFIVENNGTSKAREVSERLACITSVNKHGIIQSEAWQAFIASYYSSGNNTKHITEPVGTFTTLDRMSLVKTKTPDINDCYYRMLLPEEIKLGMAFDKDYKVLGNGKEQVKQLGNAVTPPAMEMLVERCVKTLQ
ncbi:MAG: DNA cytosine methyltransferase [Chryseotalea sp.]